jgi:hypothetical protein
LGTILEGTIRRGCDDVGGNNEAEQHIDIETNPPINGMEDTDQGNGTRDIQETGPKNIPPQPLPQTGRK